MSGDSVKTILKLSTIRFSDKSENAPRDTSRIKGAPSPPGVADRGIARIRNGSKIVIFISVPVKLNYGGTRK